MTQKTVGAKETKVWDRLENQIDQIRYEFVNQDTIAIRHNGLFYKAVGNSAIYMKMLGGETAIRRSYCPMAKKEIYEMSFHIAMIAQIKKYLKDRGGEVLREDKGWFVFRLAKPFTLQATKTYKRSKEFKQMITEDILTAKNRPNTPLAKEVRDLKREMGFLVRAMPGVEGAVLGRELIQKVIDINNQVRILMRQATKEDKAKCSQLVTDAIDDMQGLLLMVTDVEHNATRLGKIGGSLSKMLAIVSPKED